MQADIKRLCGSAMSSMAKANDNEDQHRRRVQSTPTAKEMVLERDPAYLAQMQARKAILQSQAMLLQAQTVNLEVAGAAD
jgi:hypothetical protein